MKLEGDDVYLQLPSIDALDEVFATEKTCNGSCDHSEDAHPKPKTLSARKPRVGDALVAGAAD